LVRLDTTAVALAAVQFAVPGPIAGLVFVCPCGIVRQCDKANDGYKDQNPGRDKAAQRG